MYRNAQETKASWFQHYILRTFSPTVPFHLSYASHAEIKSRDLTVTPTLLFNLWYTSSARGYVGVTCSCEIKSDVAVADLGLLLKRS